MGAGVGLAQQLDTPSCMQSNWDVFIDPSANENTTGHLMSYPIQLKTGGGVSLLPACETIPDFPGTKMFGSGTNLPYVLTT